MSRVGKPPLWSLWARDQFYSCKFSTPPHFATFHTISMHCFTTLHCLAHHKYECTQNSEMHIVYWTMHSSYTVKHLQKACCSRILDNVHWWTILGTFWGGTSQWCPLQLSHAFWASRGWPATADSLVIIGTFSPEMLKLTNLWLVGDERAGQIW